MAYATLKTNRDDIRPEIVDDYFFNASGVKVSASRMVDDVICFIREDDRRRYKIMVGSDSEGLSDAMCDFVTAIVVHRVGNGGRYFWRRREFPRFYTLRDRIIQEVLLSIDAATNILKSLRDNDAPQFDFEIHVDIGENGETKVMLQEVLGMIRAYNFEARTKPESYAASKVADRHV